MELLLILKLCPSFLICILLQTLVNGCEIYEYGKHGTCFPCRICPEGIHQGGMGVDYNEECHKNIKVFLPDWIGTNLVRWCDRDIDPIPSCKMWSDPHGQVKCTNGTNMTIGSQCWLECDKGYQSTGISLMCNGNLTWTLPKPHCLVNKCQKYNVTNGVVTCPDGIVRAGDRCNVTCAEGYYIRNETGKDGIHVPVCKLSNSIEFTWSMPLPICKKKVTDVGIHWKSIVGIIVGVAAVAVILVIVLICLIKRRRTCSNFKGSQILPNRKKSCTDSSSFSSNNSVQIISKEEEGKDLMERGEADKSNDSKDSCDEDILPELNEENAGVYHLVRVHKSTVAMKSIRRHFNREEKDHCVTWHVVGENLLGWGKDKIKNIEYEKRADAYQLVMDELKMDRAPLKKLLDFLVKCLSDPEQSLLEKKGLTSLIREIFQEGNSHRG